MRMKSQKTVLIVVAHSDDEALGMGASIYKHSLAGDKVFALSLTDGVGSRIEHFKNASIERMNAATQASRILNFKWLPGENFPDNSMDTVGVLEIAKKIPLYGEIIKDKHFSYKILSHSRRQIFTVEISKII